MVPTFFDTAFGAVMDAAFDLDRIGGVCAGTIANPLAEAQLFCGRAVDDALAFALALAVLTWIQAEFTARREAVELMLEAERIQRATELDTIMQSLAKTRSPE